MAQGITCLKDCPEPFSVPQVPAAGAVIELLLGWAWVRRAGQEILSPVRGPERPDA